MASLMFLTNLEIIDLESNFIDGISELDYLSILSKVKLLNLANNPVCSLEGYEEKIYGHLENLQMLDDFTCESGSGRLSSAGSKGSSRNSSPSRKGRGQNLKTQVLNLESDVVKVQELVTESPSKNTFFPPI